MTTIVPEGGYGPKPKRDLALPKHGPRVNATKTIPLSVRRDVRARSGGTCERCRTAVAVHMHHRLPRRFRDHSVSVIVHVCLPCHTAIHASPEHAYETGWLVRSGEDPAEVPLVPLRGEL